jgi:tol-pal system protein YbgF
MLHGWFRSSGFVSRLVSKSGWLLLWPAVAVLAAGCGTAQATAPHANNLEHNMVELRAQNAGYVRKIDELQNRIFILEDKLDSRRSAVAEARRGGGQLISKRIGGGDETPASTASTSPSMSTRLSVAVVDDPNAATVEYAGEAALPPKRGRGRLLLRLSGNGRPTVTMMSPAETAAPRERLSSPSSSSSSSFSSSSRSPVILRLYQEGMAALHAGHQAAALTSFHKFITQFPHHDFADNVQYGIGECYYQLTQYRAAVREFRRVVERYPHANKVPDAMLKIGLSRLASGDSHEGRQMLEALRRTYPHHEASRLATARLAQADDQSSSTVSLEMSPR